MPLAGAQGMELAADIDGPQARMPGARAPGQGRIRPGSGRPGLESWLRHPAPVSPLPGVAPLCTPMHRATAGALDCCCGDRGPGSGGPHRKVPLQARGVFMATWRRRQSSQQPLLHSTSQLGVCFRLYPFSRWDDGGPRGLSLLRSPSGWCLCVWLLSLLPAPPGPHNSPPLWEGYGWAARSQLPRESRGSREWWGVWALSWAVTCRPL